MMNIAFKYVLSSILQKKENKLYDFSKKENGVITCLLYDVVLSWLCVWKYLPF